MLRWNVKGLNRELVRSRKVDVGGLVEVQVKQNDAKKVQNKWGIGWSWVDNFGHSKKGRI